MSENQASHQQQNAPLKLLAGRRIEAIRLVHARRPDCPVTERLLLMLDDGNWFEFICTHQFLPLPRTRALDIHTLLQRGAAAYDVLEMAVADPDAAMPQEQENP